MRWMLFVGSLLIFAACDGGASDQRYCIKNCMAYWEDCKKDDCKSIVESCLNSCASIGKQKVDIPLLKEHTEEKDEEGFE